MGDDEQDIFQAQKDWYHNACLSNHMTVAELGRHYRESANALVLQMVADRGLLDVYVHSAVFLYRQSLELTLKELVWMSEFLLHGKKRFLMHHRILDLWQLAMANSTALLPGSFPLTREESECVDRLIRQLHKHDPQSDAFRYPYDKKMKKTHPDVAHVNVRLLHDRCNEADGHIRTLLAMVHCFYDQESNQGRG